MTHREDALVVVHGYDVSVADGGQRGEGPVHGREVLRAEVVPHVIPPLRRVERVLVVLRVVLEPREREAVLSPPGGGVITR